MNWQSDTMGGGVYILYYIYTIYCIYREIFLPYLLFFVATTWISFASNIVKDDIENIFLLLFCLYWKKQIICGYKRKEDLKKIYFSKKMKLFKNLWENLNDQKRILKKSKSEFLLTSLKVLQLSNIFEYDCCWGYIEIVEAFKLM